MPDKSKEKVVIYQLLPRLFGNTSTVNKYYGSSLENGVGKFNDISSKALIELKDLGITHVWYTGVLEHATMADHSAAGIPPDDPDVIKGIAGSPYAIKDYYDVDPDLAVVGKERMDEFEALIKRTHSNNLKVLIDFVPNHVARSYYSDVKPAGARDFGQDDKTDLSYSPGNDYYYITGKSLILPEGIEPGGPAFRSQLKNKHFAETPAKVTGNNIFSERPSENDWFETVKLNYGVNYQGAEERHFDPIPAVWTKMRDILLFWAGKNVDGFRCDVVEMVPVEFWEWVIPQVKTTFPQLIFIGEAYDPSKYEDYLGRGNFDYLYDKVGLYDALKKLVRNQPTANVAEIRKTLSSQGQQLQSKMLRFLENHDEERIASKGFAGSPWPAVPGMVLSATLSNGPVMVYFGQEVGEPGRGIEGFGTDDNRTTIFDYWGVPEHQKWMNRGEFDGGLLSEDQHALRKFYRTLLNLAATHPALIKGNYEEWPISRGADTYTTSQIASAAEYPPSDAAATHSPSEGAGEGDVKAFAFFRKTPGVSLFVVTNFDRVNSLQTAVAITQPGKKISSIKDLLTGKKIELNNQTGKFHMTINPANAAIFQY